MYYKKHVGRITVGYYYDRRYDRNEGVHKFRLAYARAQKPFVPLIPIVRICPRLCTNTVFTFDA